MISIIIPVHNEQENLKWLIPYLEGLIANQNAEVFIAVSSRNSDNTSLANNNPKINILKCQGSGRAFQMNAAAKLANGTILAFLHADVKPPTAFITDIENTIANNYEAGFFSYQFDKQSFMLSMNASFTAKDGIFTGGGDQCLFIKKDVFHSLWGFNEAQVIMEDFELFKRMKKKNIRYTIVKNNLIVSARKYETNSYLRVNVSNLILVVLFNWGYPAPKLKSLHKKLLKLPYSTT